MSASEAERFLDWFAFDHVLPSGERPVELFRAEQGDTLPAPRRELLDRWAAAGPMSGYELLGYEQQTLRLRDVALGAEHDVYEPVSYTHLDVYKRQSSPRRMA